MYRLFYSIKYSQSRDTTNEGKEAIIMKDAFLKSADLVLEELKSDHSSATCLFSFSFDGGIFPFTIKSLKNGKMETNIAALKKF